MRNELENMARIEKYLSGNLSKDEKMLFEASMVVNQELAASVALQRGLIERINVNAFREEVALFHTNYVQAQKSKIKYKFIFNTLLLLLAAGALSVAMYALFSNRLEKPSTNANVEKQPVLTNNKTALPGSFQAPAGSNTQHGGNNLPTNNRVNGFVPNKQRRNDQTTTLVDSMLNKQPYADETSCKHLVPKPQVVQINANRYTTIVMRESKSTIHVPANILIDANGNAVKGSVELRYIEYRNSAQMAFSKIPMTYTENAVEYNMNSVGMFEIRAYQNGKPLQLKPEKAFTVDYNMTQPLDSTYFFALNDKTQTWIKLKDISVKQQNAITNNTGTNDGYRTQLLFQMRNNKTGYLVNNFTVDFEKKYEPIVYKDFSLDSGYKALEISTYKHNIVLRSPGYKPVRLKNVQTKNNGYMVVQGVFAPRKHWFNFRNRITKGWAKQVDEKAGLLPLPETEAIKGKRIKQNAMFKEGPILTPDGIDAGHTFPKLVQGLRCESFGVYNCDQTYRLASRVTVNAKYIDQNGDKIENGYVLSLIDLSFNGAFSHAPDRFVCSSTARNILLLFTKDNKLYVCDEEGVKAVKLETGQTHTFFMKDITEQAKTPEGLKQYLGI